MQIRHLPYQDPGIPDVRSGPHLLLWLGRNQWGGQLKSLAWGTLHLLSIAALPLAVGLSVQAAVDRSGEQLALSGALMALLGGCATLGDTMLHRAVITNWITAAGRLQQLMARRTASLGAALTRQVAAGEVLAVSSGDIEKVGWCVEAASRFTAALLVSLALCAGLIAYQPELGGLVAAGLLVLTLGVLPLLPHATRRADLQREKAGRASELAADTVAGLRVLRGIGGERLFLERYRTASQEVRGAAVRTARMWAMIEAVQVALRGLFLITVVWVGTRMTIDGQLSVGELVTVYGAVTFLLFPLRMFQEFAMAYSFSRPSASRAARVLAMRHPAEAGGTAGQETATAPRPDGDLYDPASGLLAAAGQLTAVVCGDPDTAGALADRLGGHAPTRGADAAETAGKTTDEAADAAAHADSVLLGGVPLDALPLEEARGAVLVQDKDPVLLSGTLGELMDVPASGEVRVLEALEAAQCGDVLAALAQGTPGAETDPLHARITERGRSLSGGQRQRLALARSLVTDPAVLVLDDPTSAVDSHTESRIAVALQQLRAGRTTVVLSSSPLVLDRADQVVLIRDGRVAASGPHQKLLRTDPEYRAVVTREAGEHADGPAQEGTVPA